MDADPVTCVIRWNEVVTTLGSSVVASDGKLPEDDNPAPACSLVSSMDVRFPPDPETVSVLEGDKE
jgi:hypothetical protein